MKSDPQSSNRMRDEARRSAPTPPLQRATAFRARMAYLLTLLSCLSQLPSTIGVQPSQRLPLNIGISGSSFLGVNQSDAEASFKAFMITIAEKRGYLLEPKTTLYDQPAEFAAAIRTNPPHVAVVDAWEYLSMDLAGKVEPTYVVPQASGLFNTYVLLTRVGSGLDAPAQLRNREVLLLESMNAKLGRAWFQALTGSLGERSAPTAAPAPAASAAPGDGEFAQLEIVSKPSLAVLPVFFGKKQSCVITTSGFAVMKELNPQLGRELQVIATSDGYMETVICLGTTGWKTVQTRGDFTKSLEELHETPAGQQVLSLFKAGRVMPFEPWYLDSIRALRAQHEHLRALRKPPLSAAQSRP